MALLRDLKKETKYTRYPVFGYIRKIKSDYPDEIAYLCIAYYRTEEGFRAVDDQFRVSDDTKTISHVPKNNVRCNAYYISGKYWVQCNTKHIAKWRFKVMGGGRYDIEVKILFFVHNSAKGSIRPDFGGLYGKRQMIVEPGGEIVVKLDAEEGFFIARTDDNRCLVTNMIDFESDTKCRIALSITVAGEWSITLINFECSDKK